MIFGVYQVESNAGTIYHDNDIPGELRLLGCCKAETKEAAIKQFDELHTIAVPFEFLI